MANANDISPLVCPLRWWQSNVSDLPSWSAAARQVILIYRTSAKAEKVLSLLNNSFVNQARQHITRLDYIEGSLMTRYNHYEI